MDDRAALKEGRLLNVAVGDGNEFHWRMVRGKKLFLYESVWQKGIWSWCGEPGRGLSEGHTKAGGGMAIREC